LPCCEPTAAVTRHGDQIALQAVIRELWDTRAKRRLRGTMCHRGVSGPFGAGQDLARSGATPMAARTWVFDRLARHERDFGPFIQKSGTDFFWGPSSSGRRARRAAAS
jgi:hypothetical protein